MRIEDLRRAIEAEPARSAWARGVKEYASDLLDSMCPSTELCAATVQEKLLDGAGNWSEYSWGGCSLIYNSDIAERLCSPSELVRCKGGKRRPNCREEWLDTQARALGQAARMICRLAKRLGSHQP